MLLELAEKKAKHSCPILSCSGLNKICLFQMGWTSRTLWAAMKKNSLNFINAQHLKEGVVSAQQWMGNNGKLHTNLHVQFVSYSLFVRVFTHRGEHSTQDTTISYIWMRTKEKKSLTLLELHLQLVSYPFFIQLFMCTHWGGNTNKWRQHSPLNTGMNFIKRWMGSKKKKRTHLYFV